MTRNQKLLLALSTLAGGALAAYFISPQSVRKVQKTLLDQARAQSQWIESGMEELGAQLDAIESQLQEVSDEFRLHFSDARQQLVEHYIPDGPPLPEMTPADVNKDLPRIPRS